MHISSHVTAICKEVEAIWHNIKLRCTLCYSLAVKTSASWTDCNLAKRLKCDPSTWVTIIVLLLMRNPLLKNQDLSVIITSSGIFDKVNYCNCFCFGCFVLSHSKIFHSYGGVTFKDALAHQFCASWVSVCRELVVLGPLAPWRQSVESVGLQTFLCSDWLILARHYGVYAKDSVQFCPESIVVHLAFVTRSIAGPGNQVILLIVTSTHLINQILINSMKKAIFNIIN